MKMRMRSGRLVDPLNLRADDVCIEDIAHGLARINRFNGQTRFEYSVARHSVNVARRLASKYRVDVMLLGLLHDAPEAYLGDIIRPVKSRVRLQYDRVGQETFDELEARTMNVILAALGIGHALPPRVSEAKASAVWGPVFEADDLELVREQQGLFDGGDVVISPMDAGRAQMLFLSHFHDLKGGVGSFSTAAL